MKEAAHLIRLAALFGAGMILFAVVRQQVVPPGFGTLGHYRAGALDDVRSRPVSFAGRAACLDCHDEQRTKLSTGKHRIVGCEACHGPQARHAAEPGEKPVLPDVATLCARCHEANAAKPKAFPQVVSKEHSGGEKCNSCHQPHSPKFGG